MSKIRDGQTNFRQDLEINGQSGEIVSTPEDEPKKFAPIHIRHSTGHLSAFAADLLKIRGQYATFAQH